jgi:hypothetical protein
MKFYGLSVFLVFNVFITSLNAYFHPIPIQIPLDDNRPYAKVEIENDDYFLLVDLGTILPLSLQKSILERLNVHIPYRTAQYMDIFGNRYEMPTYILPQVKIENVVFHSTVVNEETYTGRDGKIGRSLLSHFNLLLNFSNPVILATDNFFMLKLLGYDLDEFIKVPFSGVCSEIVFSIKMDSIEKRFMLDTGSCFSLIDASFFKDETFGREQFGIPIYSTSKFIIGGHDFGLTDLYLMDVVAKDHFDGILGMDFLKRHIVYVDFKEKHLYIEP